MNVCRVSFWASLRGRRQQPSDPGVTGGSSSPGPARGASSYYPFDTSLAKRSSWASCRKGSTSSSRTWRARGTPAAAVA